MSYAYSDVARNHAPSATGIFPNNHYGDTIDTDA